jgi:hypothetical protein
MYNNFIRSPSPVRRVSSILLSRVQPSIPKVSRGFHKTTTPTTRRIFTPSTTTTPFQNSCITPSLGAFTSPYLRSFRQTTTRISYHYYSTTATQQQEVSAHRQVVEDTRDLIFADVPKVDVKKVLVVGSGGLSIGQAGEFDYSGKYDLCI